MTTTNESLRDAAYSAQCAHRLASLIDDMMRFAVSRCAPSEEVRRAIESELNVNGWQARHLAVPQPDEARSVFVSRVRGLMMELGFSPWPSASGWAPYDLPWKERRILIGIVEGIASLSRWAHEIWVRDQALRWAAEDARLIAEWDAAHPNGPCCPVCDYCGSPRCTDGSC